MNTATQDPAAESRKARLEPHPVPPLPPRHSCWRHWQLLLWGLLLVWLAVPSSYGQSYGPAKIAAAGQLHPWTTTSTWEVTTDGEGNSVTLNADFYEGGFAIVENGQIYSIDSSSARTALGYYGNTRFNDANGQPISNMAAVDANDSFLGLGPGITAITEYPVGRSHLIQWIDSGTAPEREADYWFQRGSSGAFVAKFVGIPNGTVQLTTTTGEPLYCSPPYLYQSGGDLFLDRTTGDGWPTTNLFNSPPSAMYVNGQSYGLPAVVRISSPGFYSEAFTYQFSAVSDGRQAGFGRYASPGASGSPSVSGTAWASPGGGVQLSGVLTPGTMIVSGLQSAGGPPGSISFSAPTGMPSQGPASILWLGDTVPFSYRAGEGSDVYWDPGSNKAVVVQASGVGGLCPVSAFGPVSTLSAGYDPGTSVFSNSPLVAIDANGSLLGTPPGVVAFFGSDIAAGGGSVALNSANNTAFGPSYSWKTPGGGFGVKYINVPPRPFILSPSMGAASGMYRWSESFTGDLIVGTSSDGWIPSNMHPPTLYMNAIPLGKDAMTEQLNPTANWGWGSVTYGGVALGWNCAGSIAGWQGWWSWSDASSNTWSGTWDGGDGFSGTAAAGIVLSFSPAPTAARYGPGKIAWDGTILTFNPAASVMSGGNDVYLDATGNLRMQVNADGTNAYYSNSVTGITGSGSYNAATRRFDFGPSFTGVVQALNVGEQLAGDMILAGSLDVHGSTFSFATDASSLNKPAFAWLHRSGPVVSGAPSGNHLRWLTATSLYEWTWEAPSSSGKYDTAPLMALRSHPFPTLSVSVPITSPYGQVIIGPYNDTSWDGATSRAQGVFVVAAGNKNANTGVITPRNALRVLDDGTVLLRPSGDIIMGEFTAGPQP